MNERARLTLAYAVFAFGQAVRAATPERCAFWLDQVDAAIARYDGCQVTPAPVPQRPAASATPEPPRRLRWWQRWLRLPPIAGTEALP